MSIFKLPDLGEGLPDAEISAWHVKVGDEVKVDEPLVAMETAKAIVEVPSPQAGKIVRLHGKPGDVIKTGSPLVEFLSDAPAIADTGTVAGKIEVGNTILVENAQGITVNANTNQTTAKVTPAIRALAKQMGVDIALVTPTGPNHTITAMDLQNYGQNNIAGSDPNFISLTGARKSMAQAMLQSHREVVPATVMDDAVLFNWSETEDISVRIIQAIIAGVKQEPALNAWFNGATLGRKLIDTLDLGIACDTEDGLFVPVIKNVAALSATAIRAELEAIKQSVQARSIPPAKLRGASFTLSNFGKFAGRYASPVVVPPQVAILGAGAIRQEVVAVNGKVQVSKVLPLSLTFDHRACTGGEATRFLAAVIQNLSA